MPRRRNDRRVDGPYLHSHAAGTHHHQRRVRKKDENPGQIMNKENKNIFISCYERIGRFGLEKTKFQAHTGLRDGKKEVG